LYLGQIREKIPRFVRDNWGFPFVFAFLMLLFVSAALLFAGFSMADETATTTYFVLAAGVVLQLVCFSRNKFKNGVALDGSS
jgi:hypothetical protein